MNVSVWKLITASTCGTRHESVREWKSYCYTHLCKDSCQLMPGIVKGRETSQKLPASLSWVVSDVRLWHAAYSHVYRHCIYIGISHELFQKTPFPPTLETPPPLQWDCASLPHSVPPSAPLAGKLYLHSSFRHSLLSFTLPPPRKLLCLLRSDVVNEERDRPSVHGSLCPRAQESRRR